MTDAMSPPMLPHGFLRGVGFAFRGLPFVARHPRLLALSLLPVLINLALLIGIFGVGLRFYDDALSMAFPWVKPESWLVVLWWIAYALIRVVLYLALLVVTLMLVVVFGSIIASPFHDALSERTEILVRGKGLDTPFSLTSVLRELASAVVDQIFLLSLYLLGLILVVLFALVPVAGTLLSSVASFVWTCWFFAVEFTDGPLTRSGRRWRERWSFLMSHARLSLGFGVGAWVMLLVPLTLPFLVVSGTLMVCELTPGPLASATTRPPLTPEAEPSSAS
ncbi:MAG: EI24 domain-containing protein [Pseudomonadota bacterium]